MKRSVLALVLCYLSMGILSAQDINAAIEQFNRGNQYIQSEQYDQAIMQFHLAMELALPLGQEGAEIVAAARRHLPNLYYMLAVQDYRNKKIDKAIDELKDAIKYGQEYQDPETVDKARELIPKLYYARGNDLFKENKFDEALTNFQLALEYNPDYSRAYWGLGLVYNKQNKTIDMDIALKKARELAMKENDNELVDRINTNAKRFLVADAQSAIKAQKWNDAITALNLSNDYKADDADTYYYLAVAYNNLKNWNGAIEAAQKGIELSSGDTNENRAKFYFELGNAYKGVNNTDKACEAFKNARFGKFVENAKYEIETVLKCK